MASTLPRQSSTNSPKPTTAAPTSNSPDVVSQQIMEHLLAELVEYSVRSTKQEESPSQGAAAVTTTSTFSSTRQQQSVFSAEMSAAKLERIGYRIGYAWTERLAQHKSWNTTLVATQNPDAMAQQVAAQQLEAVKFLCKEVWVQVFGKQIDKLQTNHRGVFVLKDLDLVWLQKFPNDTESSRVRAMQWLALPCGLIRGCLADLGIPSVVSCDFMADGQNMAVCSFNVKVK